MNACQATQLDISVHLILAAYSCSCAIVNRQAGKRGLVLFKNTSSHSMQGLNADPSPAVEAALTLLHMDAASQSQHINICSQEKCRIASPNDDRKARSGVRHTSK